MKTCIKLFFVALILISANSYAQKWINKLESENSKSKNFYEIQKAFYKNHEGIPIEDYQRDYKKFKRWETYMSPRVNENGQFPVKILWEESQKIYQQRKNAKDKNNSDWQAMGPAYTPLWTVNNILNNNRSGTGRIECIEFHPTNNDIIWVGAHSGGLWKTVDGGENWYTTTDELISIGISDIVVHPENPDVLFIGTGDRDTDWAFSIGLLKSTDGGETFEETGLNYEIQETEVITKVLINSDNPEIMIVSTTEGIYKSVDSGINWELTQYGNFRDIDFKPGDPYIVYATSYNFNGGANFYKSIDGGSSFSIINTGMTAYAVSRISIGVSLANPEIVYLVACKVSGTQANLYGLYKSEDSGETWTEIVSGDNINLLGRMLNGNDTEGYGWYTLSIEVSPINPNQLFVGGINMWRSDNGGQTWQIKTTEQPNVTGVTNMWVDFHEIRVNPFTNTLFVAHDGGIYKSIDHGDSFTDITDGLNINQMYRIGCSASDENVVVAGCQDQFGMLINNGEWKALYTGEASEHFIDYTNPDILFCYGFMFGMIKSVNGGYSYYNINPPGVGNNHWLVPTIMHPTDPNTIYLGINGVYKSTNQGTNWETLTPSLSGSELESLAVAASDDNYIYASSPTSIWQSKNGGTAWANINSGLPGNRIITDIAISDVNPEHIWISLARFNENEKVYESTDGGITWENISGNLPNVPVNTIVHESGPNDGVYIGTDVGIFYINDNLTEWIDYSNGLPNVVVLEIEIQYGSNKLRAGTYGRGLWESELYDNTTAVNSLSHLKEFSVVPNPVKDEFVIRLMEVSKEVVSFRLKNIYGDKVQFIVNSNGEYEYHFDCSSLRSGVYIIEFLINNKVIASKKIIKI